MTDKFQRIREALTMGPTPGPFFVINDADVFTALGSPNAQGTHSDEDDGWHVAGCLGGATFVNGEEMSLTYSESKANAHLFAACDPDTIRALLDERDALQAEHRILESELATVKQVAYGNMNLLDECEKLRNDVVALVEALQGLLNIVSDSSGVVGYHLNGNIADWDEFEEVENAEVVLSAHRKQGEKP